MAVHIRPEHVSPPFPSLYWPYRAKPGTARYLHISHDIWRYTLLWTLIIYGVFHLAVASFAILMQIGKGKRAWQYVWAIPVVYLAVAGCEALLAGSVVGLMLGAVYTTASFQMSTWIPFIWGLINVLVLILSSFSMQGGV